MADRHTITIQVKDGRVAEVQFCDCCPALTLEVRTYTDNSAAAAVAQPVWHLGGGVQESEFHRDEQGVFSAAYYEPEDEDE